MTDMHTGHGAAVPSAEVGCDHTNRPNGETPDERPDETDSDRVRVGCVHGCMGHTDAVHRVEDGSRGMNRPDDLNPNLVPTWVVVLIVVLLELTLIGMAALYGVMI